MPHIEGHGMDWLIDLPTESNESMYPVPELPIMKQMQEDLADYQEDYNTEKPIDLPGGGQVYMSQAQIDSNARAAEKAMAATISEAAPEPGFWENTYSVAKHPLTAMREGTTDARTLEFAAQDNPNMIDEAALAMINPVQYYETARDLYNSLGNVAKGDVGVWDVFNLGMGAASAIPWVKPFTKQVKRYTKQPVSLVDDALEKVQQYQNSNIAGYVEPEDFTYLYRAQAKDFPEMTPVERYNQILQDQADAIVDYNRKDVKSLFGMAPRQNYPQMARMRQEQIDRIQENPLLARPFEKYYGNWWGTDPDMVMDYVNNPSGGLSRIPQGNSNILRLKVPTAELENFKVRNLIEQDPDLRWLSQGWDAEYIPPANWKQHAEVFDAADFNAGPAVDFEDMYQPGYSEPEFNFLQQEARDQALEAERVAERIVETSQNDFLEQEARRAVQEEMDLMVKNRSGHNRAQAKVRAKTDESKEMLEEMTNEQFQKTVSTADGGVRPYQPGEHVRDLTYVPGVGLTNKNAINLDVEEYVGEFNSNLHQLNEIIGYNNKTGIPYEVTELTKDGMLRFRTYMDGEWKPNVWKVDIQPGLFRGDVKDIANTEYLKSLPGLNMNSSSTPLFGPKPIQGSGTYKSINEYLKKYDLGRVKAGFNTQTDSSRDLWEHYIKDNKAYGFMGSPFRWDATMLGLAPAAMLGLGNMYNYEVPQTNEYKYQ